MNDSQSWDDYWNGSISGVAFDNEGAQHPQLAAFWEQALREAGHCGRLLDVASGRGALLEYVEAAALKVNEIIATDYSEAGLISLCQHHDQVKAVVADAASLPFAAESMDLMVSQFGVEYAGTAAVASLPSFLADRGCLIVACHANGSIIYNECQTNLAALTALKESQFLEFAEDMFRSGYLVIRGQIGRKEAGAMARRVIEPFNGLRDIMDKYGENVAGGTIRTLYQETARIQQRFQYHLEDEVMNWIQSMKHEVGSYMGRMNSMMDAALDESEIEEVARTWSAQGVSLETKSLMHAGEQGSLAWILKAVRS